MDNETESENNNSPHVAGKKSLKTPESVNKLSTSIRYTKIKENDSSCGQKKISKASESVNKLSTSIRYTKIKENDSSRGQKKSFKSFRIRKQAVNISKVY